MKYEEIQNEIEKGIEKLETFSSLLRKTFEDIPIDTGDPDATYSNLAIKTGSGLYSEEERGIIVEFSRLAKEHIDLIQECLGEAQEYNRLQKELQDYEYTFNEEDIREYQDIQEKLTKDAKEAEKTLTGAKKALSSIYAIGWKRYFSKMKYPGIINDIQKIADSFHLEERENLIEVEGRTEPGYLLISKLDTKHYAIDATFLIDDRSPSRKFIEEEILLKRYFHRHLKEIEYKKMPKGEAEAIISDMYRSLTAELNRKNTQTEIEKVTRKPVKKFAWNRSMLQREIFSGQFIEDGTINQITIYDYEKRLKGGEIQKKDVHTYYSMSYNDLPGVENFTGFTPEEADLYDAIYSEIKAGNFVLTNNMIYKTLMGGDSKAQIPPKKDEEFTEFIENCAKTRIKINNRENAQKRGDNTFLERTANLLYVDGGAEREIDGKVIHNVWVFGQAPILGQYGESISQIEDIPMNLIQTGTNANYNPAKFYLLKQIRYMKKGRNRKIDLTPMFTLYYPGIEKDRKKRRRVLGACEDCLAHWIREKEIYSYELLMKGGTTHAIKIYLSNGKDITTKAGENRVIALENRNTKAKKKANKKA